MPFSSYLKTYSCPSRPGHCLLFSTINAATALLDRATYHDLLNGRDHPEITAELSAQGMFVDDPGKERREVSACLEELNRVNSKVSVAVIPGMACNFACRYCYEGGNKGSAAMSDGTTRQLITFLAALFQPDRKIMNLDFYGGEPLLYTSYIKFVSSRLKPLIEDKGGAFEFTMLSNGSLLKPEIIEELLPLGLKAVRITIDGPEDNHNFFRPLKAGRPSFSVIINNLKECAGLTHIGLNSNFTRDNYQTFPGLLDFLLEADLGPERIGQINFSPVIQVKQESIIFQGGCGSGNEPWLAEAVVFLRAEILKRGYSTSAIIPSPCMVDMHDSFTVHYDGTICKCPALIGREKYVCGDIWSKIVENRHYHLNHWQRNEECGDCEYLPLCFGGCRFMALQRWGHMAKVDCRRDFYDAALEKLIRQDIMSRMG